MRCCDVNSGNSKGEDYPLPSAQLARALRPPKTKRHRQGLMTKDRVDRGDHNGPVPATGTPDNPRVAMQKR